MTNLNMHTAVQYVLDRAKKAQAVEDSEHASGRDWYKDENLGGYKKFLELMVKHAFSYYKTYDQHLILSGGYNKLISRQIRKELVETINTRWKSSDNEIMKEIKTYYRTNLHGASDALKKLKILDAVDNLPKKDIETLKQEIHNPEGQLYRALNFKRRMPFLYSFFNILSNTLTELQKNHPKVESITLGVPLTPQGK